MDTALIFFLLICIAQTHGVLQWSASSPADGASVPVCDGQQAVLDWNYMLEPQDHLEDIRWFVSKDTSEELVASFTMDSLFISQNFSGRVRHLGNAAIALDYVTMEDSGLYSVEVHVSSASGKYFMKFLRSVSLTAVGVASLELTVRQGRRAAYNKDTGDLHVKLECGPFGDLDQPFVDVIWQTPSWSSLPSSNYHNGYFELLLDNPVQGGDYSCRLNPSAPFVLCFRDNDTALQEVTVTVDEVKARLTLIEARQTEQTARARVSFFARLSLETTVTEPNPVILTKIYNNEGRAYNPITGSFVVPRNGTYSVTAGVQANNRGSMHVNMYLMVDDEWMCTAHSHYTDGVQGNSCTAVLHLEQGQRVWLKAEGTSYFNNEGTFFTGVLLYADE